MGLSHTALSSEGGGYGRKDGDEDVEDFTPSGIVVESSHSVSWFLRLVIYQRDGTRTRFYSLRVCLLHWMLIKSSLD